LSADHPAGVRPIAVALVPVADAGAPGLLVVSCADRAKAFPPRATVQDGDPTWQDALVRAIREQAGLDVDFESHVRTVSGPDGQMLIFGQTRVVDPAAVADARTCQVVGAGEVGATITCEVCADVMAHWFAQHADVKASDRRGGGTGRRAADAEMLARTDLAAAVQAVHDLLCAGADFEGDQYASTLLDHTLRGLLVDQRARWGERAAELLLTFLWNVPRDRLPVDYLFERVGECARAGATDCFAEPGLERARAWMDTVALAHGLGRVMAPVHAADPVGLVRSILGFGPFGRLSAKLDHDVEAILSRLGESQWEAAYVALGATRPPVLTPAALEPDVLASRFADVLANPRALAAP
jgi:hypothetical protein